MSEKAKDYAWPQVASLMNGRTGRSEVESVGGMLLRDHFAAIALPLAWQIECAAPTGPYREHMEPTYKGAAQRAYFFADAMLAERGGD